MEFHPTAGSDHGAPSAHVETRGLSKRYEGIVALNDIDLTVRSGTVHALVGENGAGKSTLGKLIAGAARPDEGAILVSGREVDFHNPRDALRERIALVHQELALAPALSVLDNVFLGVEDTIRGTGLVRLRRHRRRFGELMEETGFGLDPDVPANALRVADQQKVEVTRALARDAQLIVFDEPTAALNDEESALLLDVVRLLRSRGVTVIYVSHNLGEVLSLADDVTVLKDGELVATSPASTETVPSLITNMLGRKLEAMFPPKPDARPEAPSVLRVRNLHRTGVLHDISLDVREGEIVGLAGLVGSGRSELARCIFGADPSDGGTIEVRGEPRRVRTPRHAVHSGIAMLPENRKEQGLVMNASVRGNLTLASLGVMTRGGWIRRHQERDAAQRVADDVDVRMGGLDMTVSLLSGGNQQKVALAKWLMCKPAILIADEPTRGVDVGARSTIYRLIRELAEQGLGVLLISSELEEVMGMADRILVIHRGRIRAELEGNASEDEILRAAFGGQVEQAA